ncbi:hypothetical protein FQN50_009808 [Emmonsiellopsis sp. PD_5]|nr:hypothetical protein FQN50_009808 [Emmonsiellopsis sp. PD_5]
MTNSISPISSLSRSVSSTSLKSLEASHDNQPPLPPPKAHTNLSVSEIPRRKPLPTPQNTSYLDAGTVEQGTSSPYPPQRPLLTGWSVASIREKAQFGGDKKKQKQFLFLAAVAFAILLALIIGLAVGLSSRKSSNLPLPTANGGPYTGDLTYYDPGLGACGISSSASEPICAVSQVIYDAVSTSADPNQNPLCGLMIRLKRGERSVDVRVVDRCVGCQPTDIDVSMSVFTQLALVEQGRVDVQWAWLDKPPVKALQG